MMAIDATRKKLIEIESQSYQFNRGLTKEQIRQKISQYTHHFKNLLLLKHQFEANHGVIDELYF